MTELLPLDAGPSPTTSPDASWGADVDRERAVLRDHPLYRGVHTPDQLRAFTEHHVVCVLDFMSLLKSLQRDLTCVAVPWVPAADGGSARLVHEILLDEESDRFPDGRTGSHFEWYLEAMEEIGASTTAVRALVTDLRSGRDLRGALRDSELPLASRAFGLATADDLERPLVERVAVFLAGREEVIPEMFLPIVAGLEREGLNCSWLRAYLERHIEVDGGEHSHKGRELLARLVDGVPARAHAARMAALGALRARRYLWDGILAACR